MRGPFLAALLCAAILAAQPSTPDRVLHFGVCTHFELKSVERIRQELGLMERAGIHWLRYDFRWNNLEPERGSWNFAHYDAVVRESARRNIKILAILDYGNAWASPAPPGAPRRERWLPDEEAWTDYVRTVVSRYKRQIHHWQVWNEPNVPERWQPRPSPSEYVQLLRAAHQAIKRADPGATVILSGLAGMDLPFLKGCADLGALQWVDAVAFHPYQYPRPPEDFLNRFITVMSRTSSEYSGRAAPIWLTEVGWPTEGRKWGIPEKKQADYLARTFLLALDSPVTHLFWYDLVDDGHNPSDVEHHFGLVAHDLARTKPAYAAARNLLSLFSSPIRKLEGELSVESDVGPPLFLATYWDATQNRVLVPFWCKDGNATFKVFASLRLARGQARLISLLGGGWRPLAPWQKAGSRFQSGVLTATPSPQLIEISQVHP